MKKNISTKEIVIIVVVLALLGLAYFYFSGQPADSSSLTADAAPSPVTNEASKILTLLNQTTSLKIDPAIFNSPVYKSLVDHTVQVIPQPIGKPNPFIYTIPAPSPQPKK